MLASKSELDRTNRYWVIAIYF